jgi:hypothetical protein
MTSSIRNPRRIGLGVIALALALGGVLAQPVATSAGFGSSLGSHRAARGCDSGTHIPEVTLSQRKASEGQKDYL